jgi:RHH-type transcriptional regulator, proline utilization regulon repressor / proline dehydrogenase / delta 1-pyrroline-5-carboxylate dehydrogenase
MEMTQHSSTDIQKLIKTKGEAILKKMESQSKPGLFSRDFWYGSIMEWSMKNEKFKTNMFRFVDVLPSLQSGQEVSKHLKEYFTENGGELPPVFNVGLGLGSLAPSLMAGAIKKNVTAMAKMFITGETPEESLSVLKKARKDRMTFTVDILGEATLSEKEAAEYQNRYMELVDWLARDSQKWETIPQIDQDHEGDIPKINVSVKLSALFSQINDKAWDFTKTELKSRLRPILKKAMKSGVFINLDMEHYAVKHLTLEVFKDLMIEDEFKSYRHFGCVVQAYLRDSAEDIRDLILFAAKRGTPFTVRLVKGAYWDSETIEAEQKSWACPVYTVKAETDANYEICAKLLLDAHKVIRVALASHNVRSLAAALVHAEGLGLPKNAVEIQMLYGMAEPIKKTFVEMGYRVREYAPLGDLLPGMAYLVRRLLENTSNESWLRGKFAEGKSLDDLLADPAQKIPTTKPPLFPKRSFYNEPYLDFAVESDRQKMASAIQNFKLEQKVTPVVDGQHLTSGETFSRLNPSNSSEVVAQVTFATQEQTEKAIQSAHSFWKDWKKTPIATRAHYLEKVADIMTAKKFELSATQVFEVGKPWAEADADVAEAIDFCRYYATNAREIFKTQKVGGIPGETSDYIYRSRGVTAVISPWNFPLAILTGQVAAALVTGNTVVMKPAEQSSLVAMGLFQILREAGVPSQAVQFMPGLGEVVGAHLVNHPLVTTIAFTGSKAVGLLILNQASVIKPGQQHVKRCIIEMGGKNAVIIDNDADLDEAVDGVLYSAFGFAGQKCSAASRCIILEDVYERFKDRLVEAAKSITLADAKNPIAYLGPVVDEEAYSRLMGEISKAEKNKLVLYKSPVPENGYYVPVTILENVKAPDYFAQTEFFGPLLALIKVKDLKEALEVANSTEYALTGGLFSRSPENISLVKEEFVCGNLYINRGITGAMVDRHPFGGFKMSGIGSKTGGPDYLRQFVEPVCLTENTLRRGFAPLED